MRSIIQLGSQKLKHHTSQNQIYSIVIDPFTSYSILVIPHLVRPSILGVVVVGFKFNKLAKERNVIALFLIYTHHISLITESICTTRNIFGLGLGLRRALFAIFKCEFAYSRTQCQSFACQISTRLEQHYLLYVSESGLEN